MNTLVDLLRGSADRFGPRPAVSMRTGLREQAWSYARLWQAAQSAAWWLRAELGVPRGGRVVVWAPNSPSLVATLFGAFMAHAIVIPLDPYSTPEFVQATLEDTDASVLIAGFPLAALRTGRPVRRLADVDFESLRTSLAEEPRPDDVAEVVYTSGSTGAPKGVMLTHANIVADVEAGTRVVPEDPSYRLLSVLPLSHMFEQTAGLFLPLRYGDSIFYPATRQPPVLLKALRRHHIVTMVVVPQVLSLMLRTLEREVERQGRVTQWRALHRMSPRLPIEARRWLFREVHARLGGSLRFFLCGGAAVSPELQAVWERMGVKVVQGYGATECAPVIASNTLAACRAGSVGRPLQCVQTRLSDEHELLVRGPNVTPGYWRNPVATAENFTFDGWYRTGDLAHWDADGYLYVDGRLNDLIVLPSGMKVHPDDVEAALRRQSEVADCAVVGRPDHEGAVQVYAAIVLAAEVAGLGGAARDRRLAAAVQAANASLAPHQRITGFCIWQGELPRTPLEKVRRHEILAVLGQTPNTVQRSVRASAAQPEGSQRERTLHLIAAIAGLSPDGLSVTSDLALEAHLDSLARVELAARLEEDLGVAVDEAELARAGRVADVLALVEGRQVSAPGAAFPAWARSRLACFARPVLQNLLIFPVHGLVCRPFDVQGLEQLNGLRTPALLIANHTSHVDTPSILRAVPAHLRARLAVAAAADYFYGDRRLGWLVSLALNTFPFTREGGVRATLEYCGELVDEGWSLLAYPEGTRSPSGEMHPFKAGIGLMACELGVPIVPIAVDGGYTVLPKGRAWPRRGLVRVRFGPPISLPPDATVTSATTLLESAVRRTREELLHADAVRRLALAV